MTPVELAAMVDRLAPQTSSGPWTRQESPQHSWSFITDNWGDDVAEVIGVKGISTGDMNHANAEAIALVPALMAENQRIRHELEALRDDADQAGRTCDEIGAVEADYASKITRILEGKTP